MEFGNEFSALGVLFKLDRSSDYICEVANTAARIEEVTAEIDKVIQEKKITKLQAARLRGRMVFAEAQLFGRVGRRCVIMRSLVKATYLTALDEYVHQRVCAQV